MQPKKTPGLEIDPMNIILSEKTFEVKASRDRVWRLIGKVIFSSLPGLESVEILDENTFRALLKMKLFGLGIDLKLQGEMVDMLPPESFAVKLFIKGPGGLFATGQKVSFVMTPGDNNWTRVSCKAIVENLGFFPRLILLGQARHFAQSTFESIEKRLKELA
jgi:carbon monoxide dehydrogenase subunit G